MAGVTVLFFFMSSSTGKHVVKYSLLGLLGNIIFFLFKKDKSIPIKPPDLSSGGPPGCNLGHLPVTAGH